MIRSRWAVVLGLCGTVVGQGGFQAQWTALAPIVAQWTNAPNGTAGAVVSHPAGPLPNGPVGVGVAVGTWPDAARFDFTPLPLEAGMVGNWSCTASSWLPFGQQSRTTADLLLQIGGPAGSVCSIDLRLVSFGDTPSPFGFRVDLGNDGVFEVDTTVTAPETTDLDRRAAFAWDFDQGPLPVRVVHDAGGFIAPQWFGLQVSLRPWSPLAADVGRGCEVEGTAAFTSGYCTNYHLAALPPAGLPGLAELRATGIGPFGAFFVGVDPATVAFPLWGAPAHACDVLANIVLSEAGFVSRTVSSFQHPIPVQWATVVPLLPPGLQFYVQHASLQVPHLGFTNRIRIRT